MYEWVLYAFMLTYDVSKNELPNSLAKFILYNTNILFYKCWTFTCFKCRTFTVGWFFFFFWNLKYTTDTWQDAMRRPLRIIRLMERAFILFEAFAVKMDRKGFGVHKTPLASDPVRCGVDSLMLHINLMGRRFSAPCYPITARQRVKILVSLSLRRPKRAFRVYFYAKACIHTTD